MTKQHLWERVHEPYTQGHISQRGRKKDKMGEVRSLAVARMEIKVSLDPFFHCLGIGARVEESSGHWSSKWDPRNPGSTGRGIDFRVLCSS